MYNMFVATVFSCLSILFALGCLLSMKEFFCGGFCGKKNMAMRFFNLLEGVAFGLFSYAVYDQLVWFNL
jgi:hypothetical protein